MGILGQNGFESFSSTPAFGQLSYMSGCCQLCASCGEYFVLFVKVVVFCFILSVSYSYTL